MKRILIAPALLLALLPADRSAQGYQEAPVTLEASIEIGTDAAGVCSVTVSPEPIRGAQRNNRIVWKVKNGCEGDRTVGVANFKHRQENDRRKEPLNLERFPRIAPGESAEIRGMVKVLPRSDLGTYKYDILIDGDVAEDPEIVIDR